MRPLLWTLSLSLSFVFFPRLARGEDGLDAGVADGAVDAWVPPAPSPDRTRGLPECPPGTTLPTTPGTAYTCRPPWDSNVSNPNVQVDVLEMGFGGVAASTPLQGSAFTIGVNVTLWLAHEFGIGLRYSYVTGGQAARDLDGDHLADATRHALNAQLIGLGPRLRLFTDETAREAWLVEADMGLVLDPNQIVPTAPFARLGLFREVGFLADTGFAGQIAIGLSATQGLLDAGDFRALLFTTRLGIEGSPMRPRNLDQRWRPAGFDYTFSVAPQFGGVLGDRGHGRPGFGLGLAAGFPFLRAFEPRVEALAFDAPDGGPGDALLWYETIGALRVRFNDVFPAFIEAGAGYQWVFGTQPKNVFDDGPIASFSLGLHGIFGHCSGASISLRYERGLVHANAGYEWFGAFFDFEYGSRSGALGDERYGGDEYVCNDYSAPSVPSPPAPPPPPTPPSPPPTEVRVDLDASLDVNAHVDLPTVHVDVHPVTVEVTLGLALFGGAVQMRIDVSSLPLEQLRNSGFVSVELIGPEAALAEASGELHAALGPDGAHVEGWAQTIANDRADVRAIFTIWPPGSRPLGSLTTPPTH